MGLEVLCFERSPSRRLGTQSVIDATGSNGRKSPIPEIHGSKHHPKIKGSKSGCDLFAAQTAFTVPNDSA